MTGISNFVSVDEMYEEQYLKLSKIGKLYFDLELLGHAGFSGPINANYSDCYETRNGIHATRKWFSDEIRKMILKEERKEKLKQLKINNYGT